MPTAVAGTTDAGTDGAVSGACPESGCTLTLARAGTARHAGQLVAEDGSFHCGSGTSDEVQFGVEVECGAVTLSEGKTVVINALVARGTAALFAGFEGDCVPVAGKPQRAAVLLDGPKNCTAVFETGSGNHFFECILPDRPSD